MAESVPPTDPKAAAPPALGDNSTGQGDPPGLPALVDRPIPLEDDNEDLFFVPTKHAVKDFFLKTSKGWKEKLSRKSLTRFGCYRTGISMVR